MAHYKMNYVSHQKSPLELIAIFIRVRSH